MGYVERHTASLLGDLQQEKEEDREDPEEMEGKKRLVRHEGELLSNL